MKNKIGWQKYEALLEEQMSSTFITDLLKNSVDTMIEEDNAEETAYQDQEEQVDDSDSIMIPMSSKLIEDAMMITNFDCWLGHTNFDITPDVKRILDSTQGVELLRVMSRYRFFIGVGKMFDFTEVRKNIEEQLTQETTDEN